MPAVQNDVQKLTVVRVPMRHPGDVSGVAELIDSGQISAGDILAILGKTEGNGCVNDYTRGYATFALSTLLAGRLGIPRDAVVRRVAFVMSGGTEGILSPHVTVFARQLVPGTRSDTKRLAIGVAFTRGFLPEELGRMPMVTETSKAVREAMRTAGIQDPKDVHFVQIKCPLLTSDRIEDARRRGHHVATEDTYESMGYSRGASALGVAAALREIREDQVRDEAILADWTLYSSVASTSAGVELLHNEIILMGNSTASASAYIIGHSVMNDAIDGEGVRRALAQVGIRAAPSVSAEDASRIVNVLAKAEADPSGYVRGRRHTMLNDSDINNTRHARAVVGGVIASIVGDPMIYVSGGAEHQGPTGGGPVAAIARAAA
jgi:cyanuric acid amidohydrolase